MAHPSNLGVNQISVLVAERRATARTSLSELLRREGYRVFEAPDSETSIVLLTANPGIRVILADLCMPDWLSILSHARTNVPHAVILAMTGYDWVPETDGQPIGIDHYFTKPLVFAEIKDTIERLAISTPSTPR